MEQDGMFFSPFEAGHPDAADFITLLDSLPADEPPGQEIAAWLETHPESRAKPEFLQWLYDTAHQVEETVAEIWFDLEIFTERFLFERELIQQEIIEKDRMPPEIGPLELWRYEETLSPESRAAFNDKLLRIWIRRFDAGEFDHELEDEAGEATNEPPASDLRLRSAGSPLEAQTQQRPDKRKRRRSEAGSCSSLLTR